MLLLLMVFRVIIEITDYVFCHFVSIRVFKDIFISSVPLLAISIQLTAVYHLYNIITCIIIVTIMSGKKEFCLYLFLYSLSVIGLFVAELRSTITSEEGIREGSRRQWPWLILRNYC